MKKLDISVEKWREYVFEDGFTYKVIEPETLYIAESGSHRVVDRKGIGHHVSGWRAIRWNGPVIA
jgi:hypothetical protein